MRWSHNYIIVQNRFVHSPFLIVSRSCLAGGSVGRAGRTVVVDRDERELSVYGRKQILIVVKRLGHVFGSVEDPEIHSTQLEGDQRVRAIVRQVFGTTNRDGGQGSGRTAVRLSVHVVHWPGRASNQRTVRREYLYDKIIMLCHL